MLGSLGFDEVLAFQRRLVYDVTGDRKAAALVLCEHPPLITVGREGSRAHILAEPEELRARSWSVRWVNRGGGCWLHLPGQLAIYPVVALDDLGLGLQAYLDRLQAVVVDVLDEFNVRGEVRPGQTGVWAGGRLLADVGVAVRDWVAYYGGYMNVQVPLHLFRLLRGGRLKDVEATSLARERRGPLRQSMVRERFVELFAQRFGFARVALFSDHPSLSRKARTDAPFAARA